MVVKYPYLPKGRKILYVSEYEPFMKVATETARTLSGDHMQSTGAVIVKNGVILGQGANQSILQHPKLQSLHRQGLCVRKFLKIRSGTKYWLCLGCSGYDSHAEAQAILYAKKEEKDITNADLYLYGHWWCCKSCWDKMIEVGIKNVFLLEGSERLFNLKSRENILGKQF